MVHHHMPGHLEPASLLVGVCVCGRIIMFFFSQCPKYTSSCIPSGKYLLCCRFGCCPELNNSPESKSLLKGQLLLHNLGQLRVGKVNHIVQCFFVEKYVGEK